jgi:hypothetical protein
MLAPTPSLFPICPYRHIGCCPGRARAGGVPQALGPDLRGRTRAHAGRRGLLILQQLHVPAEVSAGGIINQEVSILCHNLIITDALLHFLLFFFSRDVFDDIMCIDAISSRDTADFPGVGGRILGHQLLPQLPPR